MDHSSQQIEAGIGRQAICSISAVALGEMAMTIANFRIDHCVKLTGFMTRKSRNNQQLILHVNHVAQH